MPMSMKTYVPPPFPHHPLPKKTPKNSVLPVSVTQTIRKHYYISHQTNAAQKNPIFKGLSLMCANSFLITSKIIIIETKYHTCERIFDNCDKQDLLILWKTYRIVWNRVFLKADIKGLLRARHNVANKNKDGLFLEMWIRMVYEKISKIFWWSYIFKWTQGLI